MVTDTFTSFSSIVGVPIYAMVLLGIVPTIATLASMGRHIFGFKSFSIFVPIITTIAFLELGLIYGILVAALVFLTTVLSRKILVQFRFHYFVRVSFIYTMVCFLLFVAILGISVLAPLNLFDLKPLFPVILLTTLVEEYYKTILKEGENRVFMMFFENVIISSLAFILITSAFFTSVILNNVWLLLFLFPLNFFLATWEGLRFSEFNRFKSVINSEMRRIEDDEDDNKSKKRKKKKKRNDKNASKKTNKTNAFFW